MQSTPRSLFWRALLQLILVEKVGRKEEKDEFIKDKNEEKKEDILKNDDDKIAELGNNKFEKMKRIDGEGVGEEVDRVVRWRVGRIAEKCSTFQQYVRKALDKLKLSVKVGGGGDQGFCYVFI